MDATAYPQVELGRRPELTPILCTRCEHTEFVHGDHDARPCLYSQCGCGGFTVPAAA